MTIASDQLARLRGEAYRRGRPMPVCATCGRRKAPYGRDVAPTTAADLCSMDCAGYYSDPRPDTEWPEQLAEHCWVTGDDLRALLEAHGEGGEERG